MSEPQTCRRRIVDKHWWGHQTWVCGRTATQKQDDGLPLCERHYNRWVKKNNKRERSAEDIRPHPEAFAAGMRARHAGFSINSCPYLHVGCGPRHWMVTSWKAGWADADMAEIGAEMQAQEGAE